MCNCEIESRNNSSLGHLVHPLLLVCILALVLRLIRLGSFAFWADEAYNLVISHDLAGVFTQGQLVSNHPPMAYLLLALWRMAGMDLNEWTIRGLPALFGVLGVWAIYWLGRRLFNRRIGLTAAFILAISPFHVLHSQDLKEYIYLPFFATLMMGFFYQAIMRNRRRDWFLYGLLAGICCYTEVFVVPLLLTINCWFLCMASTHRDRIKGWVGANILGALLFLPWLGIMLQKVHTYMFNAEHWWIPWPTPWSVVFYFKTIAFGYTAIKPWFYIAFLLFAVLFALGIWQAWRCNRYAATLLVLWAVAPVIMVYGISFLGQSIFLTRALIPYAIAVYLLVAVGISTLTTRWLHAGAMAALVLVCAIGLTAYYARTLPPRQHPHRPGIHPPRAYDAAARHILEHLEEGDVVVHAAQATWLPFYWYGFSGIPHYVGGMNARFVEIINSSNPINTNDEEILRLWPQVIDTIVPGHKRIWYVFAEWEREFLPGNAAALWRWLDSRFMETAQYHFEGIEVLLYLSPEHESMAAAVARDNDTGATASIQYDGWDSAYEKRVPDTGLVPRPLAQRDGALRLYFEPSPESTRNNNSSTVRFSLENRGNEPVLCDVHVLPSTTLLHCAAFDRLDPESNTWHVGVQHHTQWDAIYEIPALSGDFNHGADTATGEVSLAPGSYIPYLYTTAPWDAPQYRIAPVTLTIDTMRFNADTESMAQANGAWHWLRGAPLETTQETKMPIRVVGTPLRGDHGGYANLAYLAFRPDPRNEQGISETHGYPEWPGEVELAQGQTRTWETVIDGNTPRVDIWAYEHHGQGKAYYIFRRVDLE